MPAQIVYTLYGPEGSLGTQKILNVAAACGVRPRVMDPTKAPRDNSGCMLRTPFLSTPHGYVSGSNACLRYLARCYNAHELYGESLREISRVDSLLDAISQDLEIPLAAAAGSKCKTLPSGLGDLFRSLDNDLVSRTFLAGEKLTIADIALASVVEHAQKTYPGADFAKTHTQLARLCHTVSFATGSAAQKGGPSAGQKGGEDKKSGAAPHPQKNNTAKPAHNNDATGAGKASPKTAAVASDAKAVDAPEAAKKPEMPAFKYDMDAWKRCYSNTKDLRGEAMPWFWGKWDESECSLWKLKYERYNEKENVEAFKAGNLLGMFYQRIDNSVRKTTFAVCNVLKAEDHYDIEGVMFCLGHELPQALKEHDQFTSFTWDRLAVPDAKQLVDDFFCEDESIAGREIAACKVYK